MAHLQYTDDKDRTFEVIVVHHRDHEGALMVDRRTGIIVTPIMERPEWAEGLTTALLVEHREYYLKRTGRYDEPQILDFADLGWLGLTEDAGTVEIFASEDMRQERLAHLLHIDPETGDMAGVLADVEHSFDQERTHEEASAIEESQEQGFGAAKEA